jgi:DNA primase
VPEGVFRELLLERLAQSIGLSADRLRSLWSGTGGERGGSLERGAEPGPGDRRAAGCERGTGRRGPGVSASGRGSLVRQAVTLLVHFPAAARGVPGGAIDALEPLTQPGMPLLRELLAQQREDPCESTGQLLERWRERPEAGQLAKLALVPVLLADVPAAALELQQLLGRLADEGQRRRIDELLAIDRDRGWTEAEKAEFQRLMSHKASQTTPEGPRGRDRGSNR